VCPGVAMLIYRWKHDDICRYAHCHPTL
jgi:hypothetical protein